MRRVTRARMSGRYGEIWGDMGRYGEIWGDQSAHVVRQLPAARLGEGWGAG